MRDVAKLGSLLAKLSQAVTLLTFVWTANAAELAIEVLDRDGRPVPDVVVLVQPASVSPPAVAPMAAHAVVDQANQQFVPYVTAVRTGTSVVFPNSDAVAHQVYSFSEPKRFELGLYRGRSHPPVVFDKPGIVVLGCNIHDDMIGYVYVTDAPYFGTTDPRGSWQAKNVAAGDYRITIWSPRASREEPQLTRNTLLADAGATRLQLRFSRALRPAPPSAGRRLKEY